MNDFNMLVLNVAVIVFIITLVVVGIILYFSTQNARLKTHILRSQSSQYDIFL